MGQLVALQHRASHCKGHGLVKVLSSPHPLPLQVNEESATSTVSELRQTITRLEGAAQEAALEASARLEAAHAKAATETTHLEVRCRYNLEALGHSSPGLHPCLRQPGLVAGPGHAGGPAGKLAGRHMVLA